MMLLDPIEIRGVRIRNRIVMPAMTTRLATEDGRVTDELSAYYEARARGGVGLITLELSSPHPSGRHRRNELGIYADRFEEGLYGLVRQLQAFGAKVSIQIGHAGSHAHPDVTDAEAVAPSTVTHPVQEGDHKTVRPRALTLEEIQDVVGWYAESAARMRRVGFDFIELQGAHDYLIAQFLSPADNKRDDGYGGDITNRARFALEVLVACRKAAGDMPVSFRMNGDEFAPEGFTKDDALALAPMLEAAGADLINVSGGSHRSRPIRQSTVPSMSHPAGLLVPLAESIKRVVRVPVIAVGRLHAPDLAESTLRAGQADMIALGRALLADPEWVNKLRDGRAQDIRPCVACNTCVDSLRSGKTVVCLANPITAREHSLVSRPAHAVKAVAVVGGGPAGMEAAIHLARRGHQVTLYERSPELGGRLRFAFMAPYFQNVESARDSLLGLADYLARATRSAGVKVVLDRAVEPTDIVRERPDAVVVAMGAPYLPGMLTLLRIPATRRLARLPVLRKLFLKVRLPSKGSFARHLRRAGIETHVVGDYTGTRGVQQALESAAEVGLTLGS
ncbi:FAD-dependent oxidoreductase [Pelagibius sp.]|uniref:FAD-dependent oxidoreductase n=1 Tax=Pelagibius sp. TaxID=1931238 RepID=UPI003BB04101